MSPEHYADRPYQFAPIPQVCLIPDVCRILRISRRQFYLLMARRALPLVELQAWDRKRRFTGTSVVTASRLRKGA